MYRKVGAALGALAMNLHLPTMHFDDAAYDGEPDSEPALSAFDRPCRLGEEVEDFGQERRLKAVEAAESFRPDVILLDIGLPGLSGYDIARRLRDKPQFASTILVALTGYGQSEDKRRSREAGFDEHLIKPAAAGALEPLFLRRRAGLAS